MFRASLFAALCCAMHAQAAYWERYDMPEVNGHPGYMSAWNTTGELDKVIVVVLGLDTTPDDKHPADWISDYPVWETLVNEHGPDGWDVVILDWRDGAQDIKLQAENLRHFVEYVNGRVGHQDYYLGLLGWSMGGIVVRTMLAEAQSNLGVDAFVSMDAPHHGARISNFVYLYGITQAERIAQQQLFAGLKPHKELWAYLEERETEEYLQKVIDPMHTHAVALSDGSKPWIVNEVDNVVQNKFFPVTSYTIQQGITTTYIAYHSAIFMADYTTEHRIEQWWRPGRLTYNYKHHGDKPSRYFDSVQGFEKAEHKAFEYSVRACGAFFVSKGPQ